MAALYYSLLRLPFLMPENYTSVYSFETLLN